MHHAIFFFVTAGGLTLAWLYGRKTRRFRWSEYFALLAGPLIVLIIDIYLFGSAIVYYFFASAVIGWLAELALAVSYDKVLGKKFWVYKSFPVFRGYISWLTLPIWGFAGLLFLRIARLFFDIS